MEPGALAATLTSAEQEQPDDQPVAGTPWRELPPGEMVGRYRIVRLLGRGGMGAVYHAERADEQYQQSVALKIVEWRPVIGGLAERFRSERQILARLAHENIARLLDGGQMQDGTPYLVMEHVAGTRLDYYCKQHRLTTEAKLKLMQQVCASVQYAHQNLVIHRDLKPSNILVTEERRAEAAGFRHRQAVESRCRRGQRDDAAGRSCAHAGSRESRTAARSAGRARPRTSTRSACCSTSC